MDDLLTRRTLAKLLGVSLVAIPVSAAFAGEQSESGQGSHGSSDDSGVSGGPASGDSPGEDEETGGRSSKEDDDDEDYEDKGEVTTKAS